MYHVESGKANGATVHAGGSRVEHGSHRGCDLDLPYPSPVIPYPYRARTRGLYCRPAVITLRVYGSLLPWCILHVH
jgi:hypothetical protein